MGSQGGCGPEAAAPCGIEADAKAEVDGRRVPGAESAEAEDTQLGSAGDGVGSFGRAWEGGKAGGNGGDGGDGPDGGRGGGRGGMIWASGLADTNILICMAQRVVSGRDRFG